MLPRLLAAIGACAVAACSSAPRSTPVNLQPARTAVQKARDAGAAEKAPQELARAESHLKAAEQASGEDERTHKAACLAEIATYEAECAVRLTNVATKAERQPAVAQDAAEAEQLAGRLKLAEEEQRRLEERMAVLQRDLDMTETEVIRTKAKLKGLETKADATSVIAETRVLFRRTLQQRGRTPSLIRCEELLDRAEAMIEAGNHGAAVFMALKVQELLKDARRAAPAPEQDRGAPRKEYVVVAPVANLRREPSLDAPVVKQLKKGTVLEAGQIRGEWIQVQAGETTGWIARSVVE